MDDNFNSLLITRRIFSGGRNEDIHTHTYTYIYGAYGNILVPDELHVTFNNSIEYTSP